MRLYHGSNVPVEKPRLFRSDRRVDSVRDFTLPAVLTRRRAGLSWSPGVEERARRLSPFMSLTRISLMACSSAPLTAQRPSGCDLWVKIVEG